MRIVLAVLLSTNGSAAVMAADATGLPPWVYAVLSLAGSGVFFRLYFIRLEKRMQQATTRVQESMASKTDAEAVSVQVQASKEAVEIVRGELGALRTELERERALSRTAQTAQTSAQAALADAQAKLNQAIAEGHEGRRHLEHKVERLRDMIGMRDAEIRRLEVKITALQTQLDALQKVSDTTNAEQRSD